MTAQRFNPTATLLLALLIALLAAPFLLTVAGDGQVHLAIAENFARGRPFQYNPTGEIVVASTSPFWTLLLTAFYWLAGDGAPALLKVASGLAWLGTAVFLRRAAREACGFSSNLVAATLLLWLGHTTIVANALGGLENVLAALQLTWLYALTVRYGRELTPRRSAALGLLLGWALLTRPDGGLFALVLLAVYGLALLLPAEEEGTRMNTDKRGWRVWRDPAFYARLRALAPQAAIMGAAALLVLLPWYAYQFSVAGKLVTDSSVARLYNGRQGALMLIPGHLYLHPKALISLATAFLPLSLGALITLFAPPAPPRPSPLAPSPPRPSPLAPSPPRPSPLITHYSPLILLLTGFIFYTFVVGAEAFGRYFLPLYPFLFLTGVAGLRRAYDWLRPRSRLLAGGLVAAAVLFMAGTSLLDAARRLGPGRFTVEHVLDVVYGPAQRQYFSFNVPELMRAPGARAARTDELLATLGVPDAARVRLAVTEVQIRYYLDERVEVLSLDGRTSAAILPYVDPRSGVPDFGRYFAAERPDFVHVNQWCAVGGWLATLLPATIEENLVCAWELRARDMDIGDAFTWAGRRVTLVAPEIVRIEWD